MGIFGLLFGTGSGVSKDTSTEEERYTAIKKTEEKREIRDAEYREIEPSEHDRHQKLKAKMFGGRFIKRTPQEEEKYKKLNATRNSKRHRRNRLRQLSVKNAKRHLKKPTRKKKLR